MALLIDARPEEVTDFKRNVPAHVLASSNDQDLDRHLSLGILAIAVGVALAIGSVAAFVTGLLVVVLQMITGPVGTHLLGRSVYRTMRPPLDGIDELAERDTGQS